ncbi:unnamed protein product [Pylaiella littoralis]
MTAIKCVCVCLFTSRLFWELVYTFRHEVRAPAPRRKVTQFFCFCFLCWGNKICESTTMSLGESKQAHCTHSTVFRFQFSHPFFFCLLCLLSPIPRKNTGCTPIPSFGGLRFIFFVSRCIFRIFLCRTVSSTRNFCDHRVDRSWRR